MKQEDKMERWLGKAVSTASSGIGKEVCSLLMKGVQWRKKIRYIFEFEGTKFVSYNFLIIILM